MCKAMSKTFVLRRQGPGMKEVSKVQQGCLGNRETEAVEVDHGMSAALSRASWLIGTDPAKGRQGSARLPVRENGMLTSQDSLY
jgi:hypothetical protein